MKPLELQALESRIGIRSAKEAAAKIKQVATSADSLDIQISCQGIDASEVANFQLPAGVLSGICDLLELMARGLPVVISTKAAELTTAQAAKFLGVSRNFVVSESDRGNLICRKVGRHRRYKPDVLARYLKLHAGRDRMQDEPFE